jgi:S-adenosylmethionine hydrolase
MTPIITLTTDFGLEDEYVGVMKGIILSRAPAAGIIDLTHLVPPQDINRAAMLIKSAAPNFPDHSIHIIVVDPGVGTKRRIILLKDQNQLFLAPDNGVLTLLYNDNCQAYNVTNKNLFLNQIGNTFHGRDIFAPVAAALATGLNPADVGPKIAVKKLISLPWPEITISKTEIQGQVVYIDHFGNLITNIHFKLLPPIFQNNLSKLNLSCKGHLIKKINSCYEDGKETQLMALFNSNDYLEISLKNGNAAQQLDSNGLDEVKICLSK